MGQKHTILSLLAYAPSTLATIFDFELEQKNKLFQIPLRSTWMCQNSFFLNFHFFIGLNLI